MGKFSVGAWFSGTQVDEGGKAAFIPNVRMVDASGNPIPAGSASDPSYAKPASAATSTRTNVAASTSSVPLLAANANRLPGSVVVNDSTSILYVLLGTGTASATNYTFGVSGYTAGNVPGIVPLPDGWVGAVQGLWVTAVGNARMTEITA